jgi:hypothetical protein
MAERFDWRTSMLIRGARQQYVMLVSRMPGRLPQHACCCKLRRRHEEISGVYATPSAPAIITVIQGSQSGCRKGTEQGEVELVQVESAGRLVSSA